MKQNIIDIIKKSSIFLLLEIVIILIVTTMLYFVKVFVHKAGAQCFMGTVHIVYHRSINRSFNDSAVNFSFNSYLLGNGSRV